jgi:hypothetical protein
LSRDIQVHGRISQRHPEISERDVRTAWRNFVRRSKRVGASEEYFVAIGFDKSGRALEMVGLLKADGTWLVYHALTPPTKAVMAELGMT